MTRYLPARQYRWFGISAVALACLSGWLGTQLHIAFVPAGLFLLTAGLLFLLAFRPGIEIHEGYVSVGGRIIPWTVNKANHAVALAALGVDGLCTDFIPLLRAAL